MKSSDRRRTAMTVSDHHQAVCRYEEPPKRLNQSVRCVLASEVIISTGPGLTLHAESALLEQATHQGILLKEGGAIAPGTVHE